MSGFFRHIPRCRWALIVALGLGLVSAVGFWQAVLAAGAPRVQFYYFNPDSQQSNLGRLKSEMDAFLTSLEYTVSFQPFAHKADLDRQLKEKQPAFLLVPAWYLEYYGPELGLKPVLQSVRNRQPFYRKVLLAPQASVVQFADLQSQTLAVTLPGPDVRKALNQQIFNGCGIDCNKLNIIVVSKDTDALFALALGQVDLALVARETVEMVGRINPMIIKAVRPLAESEPVPMPVLCYMEGRVSETDRRKFFSMFLETDRKAGLGKIGEMLLIDEWHAYSQ